METPIRKDQQLYRLAPLNGQEITGNILKKGRFLAGRAESCDIVIHSPTISSVHAVIEITEDKVKIFDMNSKNGSFYNEEKFVVKEISVGQRIRFGQVEVEFQLFVKSSLPPVLDILDPVSGSSNIKNPVNTQAKVEEVKSEDVPYVVYPLDMDPESDYSEYIFEDSDELTPIFKYQYEKQAVEVMILFKDRVFSVDYLPHKNGTYQLVGASAKKSQVEFAYLAKEEKLNFIEVKNKDIVVNTLHNYEVTHITSDDIIEAKGHQVHMDEGDIIKLENGELEIYVRHVEAPPKVKPAPFFKKDSALWGMIYLVLFMTLGVFSFVYLANFEVEEDEKDPERLARILYKPKVKYTKTKTQQNKTKPKPTKPKAKKEVTQKKPTPVKPKTVSKANKSPRKTGQKSVTRTTPKKVMKPKAGSGSKSNNKKSSSSKAAKSSSKGKGNIEVYKSFDFASTVSSLAAKGGSLSGISTASSSSSFQGSGSLSGGSKAGVSTANIGNEVGSLKGSVSGTISASKGSEGLATKSGAYVAGIPAETVVLGGLDPSTIQKILRDHLPQFRYCYQKELDRNASRNLSGTVNLIFTIGASGHVTQAGVKSSTLPSNVRSCVTRVLKGIKFPPHPGGGTSSVRQPFNFYPKRL